MAAISSDALLKAISEVFSHLLAHSDGYNHNFLPSRISLAWISSPSTRWKTFVANRVGEIHDRTSIDQWNHVSTYNNPADIVSRGCCPSQIKDIDMWWKGPEWLTAECINWPKKNLPLAEKNDTLVEERTVSNVVSTIEYDLSIIKRYSSLIKLLRVISYCKRFMHNAKINTDKIYGPIRVSEMYDATTCIIKLIQRNNF